MGNGSATIEYFEYGSTEPTRTKQVTWSGWPGGLGGGSSIGGKDGSESGSGGTAGAGGGTAGAGGGTAGAGGGSSGGAPGIGGPGPMTCGNGEIDAGETCDWAAEKTGDNTCSSVGAGTSDQHVVCGPACTWETSNCTCGNGIVDSFEECDASAGPTSRTCQEHFGKAGGDPWVGSVSCRKDCHFDTDACMPVPQGK